MGFPRVVVTGLGAITPLGLNVEDYWNGLAAGRLGVGPITRFDCTNFNVKVAGEVKGFDPNNYLDFKHARRVGRFVQFAIAAAKMAVTSARLDMANEQAERVGVVLSTSGDSFELGRQVVVINERGPRRIDPFTMHRSSAHMAPVQVARTIGARGVNTSNNAACASGNDGLGNALNHIRLGHADVIIAGGAESVMNPVSFALMGLVGALSPEFDPALASRPFDLERKGFVFAEGAGILVLETSEHAIRRKAPILAEFAGAGWSCDAYDDTAPDASGQALAMTAAIRDAGLTPDDIDYINAHGTGTQLNDAAETAATRMVFGERAYKIPISANKSMIGHLAAAAGAVEAVASVLTLTKGIIPPTIGYRTADPKCDLDYVPNVARQASVGTVLSNSFGMGGQNCCLVFRKFED